MCCFRNAYSISLILYLVRRASLTISSAVSTVSTSQANNKKKKQLTTRTIPRNTVIAHQAAVHASSVLIDELRVLQDSHWGKTAAQCKVSGVVSQAKKSLIHIRTRADDVHDLFGLLVEDLYEQRRLLRPSELQTFDSSWGLDASGVFHKESFIRRMCNGSKGTVDLIYDELEIVQRHGHLAYEKLQIADDEHIGLEILHLFILDLLGRDTPAARIFLSKSSEE
jgi:hypothetical protein